MCFYLFMPIFPFLFDISMYRFIGLPSIFQNPNFSEVVADNRLHVWRLVDNPFSMTQNLAVVVYLSLCKVVENVPFTGTSGMSCTIHCTTPVESRYSQTEREMLALVYGLEKLHMYLFGASFTKLTNHKSLLGILESIKPFSALMERLRLRLMLYEFQLKYRPGRDEANPANFLSRHPVTEP